MTEPVKPKSRKGFANASPEAKKAANVKSVATRRKQKAERDLIAKRAGEKRDEASQLRRDAEALEQEADEIDGQSSSEKYRKKYEAELANKFTNTYGGTVSPQYLKQMIAHAILRNLTVDQVVTPTMAAMDLLNDPNTSNLERKEAMKQLAVFESAKPAILEEKGESIGSVQDEMAKLMGKYKQVAPKRRKA